MSNQETNQEQIQFPAQQELKHLRTRCGKVYALGNNRFRAVVQTTPVHEYDAATHQWVELSAEKRQQMAAQAHSPIATFADSANSAENAAGILDTYVKEGSTQNFSHDERLWISNTNYYGNRLTYLKVVDLPRLGANHFITSAKLCVRNVYAPTADTAIMCTEVLEDWNPETITYDHQPNVSGVYQDYCRVLKNQYSWKEFDVTSLARKWYLGENHGVQLSAPKSESSFSQLHSSETANQPYFVLEYASLAGLESYLTYDHQSAGLAGTGSVSLVNGNLIFSHADTAMNGNRQPCQRQPDLLPRRHRDERQSSASLDYALLQFLRQRQGRVRHGLWLADFAAPDAAQGAVQWRSGVRVYGWRRYGTLL